MPKLVGDLGAFPAGAGSVTRRRATAWLGSAVPMLALSRPGRAAAPSRLRFDVVRKGDRIGEHVLDFTPTAEGQRVASHIELAIKVAFITVYRYRQDGEDQWQGGVLTGTRIDTDDNGTTSRVTADTVDGKLRVDGPKGSLDLVPGIMTDLSFWNVAITTQRQLVDSQTGELIPVEVKPEATEPVLVLGRPLTARRYAMSGSKSRSGTIWYDAEDRLVKAVVVTRGERLEYELVA